MTDFTVVLIKYVYVHVPSDSLKTIGSAYHRISADKICKPHTCYSFSRLVKHYNQAFELKFQNHNAIFQNSHPFP